VYRDPSLLHIDSDLTNISNGFEAPTDEFVGPRIFPVLRVANKSDKYRVFNKDNWGRVTDDLRAPGARANELPPMTLSRDSYRTEEHALVDYVPREENKNADAQLDSNADATERLTNTILVNRESIMVVKATTTANYASGFSTTLSGTSQWSDYTNSVPISDFKTGADKIHDTIFKDPNGVIMGRSVFRMLEDHPKILARLQSASLQVTTADAMQRIFEIPPITVAGAGKVTSNYGAAETTGYWWGKDVLLFWNPPTAGGKNPAYGYEFARPVASGDGSIMPTEREYDWDRKSDKVRVSREYDVKFIMVDSNGKSAGAGYLIKSAIA
jgi:hypothetical protein